MPQPKNKRRWTKETKTLPENHGWRTRAGNVVVVLDRGAVRFDVPESWHVAPGDDAIRIYDREPPEDDILLQASVHYLPSGVDFSGLPVSSLIASQASSGEGSSDRTTLGRGEIVLGDRADLEYAWQESVAWDVEQQREFRSRLGLARCGAVQALITIDFWPDDLPRAHAVWEEVLRSLQMGLYVADPLDYRTQ